MAKIKGKSNRLINLLYPSNNNGRINPGYSNYFKKPSNLQQIINPNHGAEHWGRLSTSLNNNSLDEFKTEEAPFPIDILKEDYQTLSSHVLINHILSLLEESIAQILPNTLQVSSYDNEIISEDKIDKINEFLKRENISKKIKENLTSCLYWGVFYFIIYDNNEKPGDLDLTNTQKGNRTIDDVSLLLPITPNFLGENYEGEGLNSYTLLGRKLNNKTNLLSNANKKEDTWDFDLKIIKETSRIFPMFAKKFRSGDSLVIHPDEVNRNNFNASNQEITKFFDSVTYYLPEVLCTPFLDGIKNHWRLDRIRDTYIQLMAFSKDKLYVQQSNKTIEETKAYIDAIQNIFNSNYVNDSGNMGVSSNIGFGEYGSINNMPLKVFESIIKQKINMPYTMVPVPSDHNVRKLETDGDVRNALREIEEILEGQAEKIMEFNKIPKELTGSNVNNRLEVIVRSNFYDSRVKTYVKNLVNSIKDGIKNVWEYAYDEEIDTSSIQFNMDDSIYVSENFSLKKKGTEEFFSFTKNILSDMQEVITTTEKSNPYYAKYGYKADIPGLIGWCNQLLKGLLSADGDGFEKLFIEMTDEEKEKYKKQVESGEVEELTPDDLEGGSGGRRF